MTCECFAPYDTTEGPIFILDTPIISNVGTNLSSDVGANITDINPEMRSTSGDGRVRNSSTDFLCAVIIYETKIQNSVCLSVSLR